GVAQQRARPLPQERTRRRQHHAVRLAPDHQLGAQHALQAAARGRDRGRRSVQPRGRACDRPSLGDGQEVRELARRVARQNQLLLRFLRDSLNFTCGDRAPTLVVTYSKKRARSTMTLEATSARPIPSADWVTIPDLHADPYPIYHRLRETAPIHWVPAVNRYLVIGYEACHTIELDQERFSADETGSLMKRSMGHSMLRKDDPEHEVERKAYGGVLRPKAIARHWNAVFERNCATYLERLRAAGPGADLVREFAAPYAAENLRVVLGFRNATQEDMQRWSQTLIDGTGNYADDPDVWAAAERSSRE